MKLSISSWPAAAVVLGLIALAAVFVVVLGWRSPATLASLGAIVPALVLGQMRPALAVGGGKAEGEGGKDGAS